ncbi:hypothetical protein RFI_33837 [Reticulomyxa filosa]|uniref:Uncharacterized protein n=1 Tax=Reticulomyxa filosa TaxID=46433 RepID=X6LS35_RETFI|nr:hypothetical protein RFI_33837 [Reticulomyxa filosa]|eukprot:ETO03565.1 hypothetical protein RFI_33837 [Reticulomyxa filosa]
MLDRAEYSLIKTKFFKKIMISSIFVRKFLKQICVDCYGILFQNLILVHCKSAPFFKKEKLLKQLFVQKEKNVMHHSLHSIQATISLLQVSNPVAVSLVSHLSHKKKGANMNSNFSSKQASN